MKDVDLILGLFYSDEANLVFDNIKVSESFMNELPKINREKLKMLSLRFLGPLFLTAKIEGGKGWKLKMIEASISQFQGITIDVDIFQSFFSLNSSIETKYGITNLFTIIGSPYTENIKIISELLNNYIHPVINQGRIVLESVHGSEYDYNKLIAEELERGTNVINYFLGSARKIYYEKEVEYLCVSVIERHNPVNTENGKRISNFYTFDIDDPLRKIALQGIPSFYVMAILPDYYETRIIETLHLFNKTSVYPNIRQISLSKKEKHLLYLEEYLVEDGIKKSYGVVLIPNVDQKKDLHNLAFYKKQLRFILDKKVNLEKTIVRINSRINPFDKWDVASEVGLDNIRNKLDNKWY
jgi:hypothetical protein